MAIEMNRNHESDKQGKPCVELLMPEGQVVFFVTFENQHYPFLLKNTLNSQHFCCNRTKNDGDSRFGWTVVASTWFKGAKLRKTFFHLFFQQFHPYSLRLQKRPLQTSASSRKVPYSLRLQKRPCKPLRRLGKSEFRAIKAMAGKKKLKKDPKHKKYSHSKLLMKLVKLWKAQTTKTMAWMTKTTMMTILTMMMIWMRR
jgi:hypothetical protein